MEKKLILFIEDEDLRFDLKEDFLDRDRYELEVISGYEAGLEAIINKDFNLIICGLKEAKLQLDLLGKARQKNFWIKTISIANCPLEDFLNKIVDRRFSFNIIGGNPPLNLEELLITVEKLFSKDIFGIDKYSLGKAKSIELKVNDSDEKSNSINKIVNFVRRFNRDQRVLDAAANIVDELLMNSLYDAPCNEEGKFLYADVDRTEKVVLKEEEAMTLSCAYDGRYLVISGSDPFGSLDRDKFVGHLIGRITKTVTQVEIKPGGGGVGIYKILEYLSAFIVNLQPKRKTEAICIIDLKWPMRQFQKRFKSFHIFTTEEKIKVAEELTVTREELDDILLVAFKGTIDESARLGRIFDTDKRKIRINLHGIRRINSCGVREWVNAIKEISLQNQLEFVECSLPMVKQFNMITNFGGCGRVVSFISPYFCPQCNKRFEKLIVLSEHLEELLNFQAPSFLCPDCRNRLEFDDLEDKYFQFVLSQESTF